MDRRAFEFGPYRLDSSERILRREGEPVQLPPKAIETLLVLVSSGGRVIDKEELIRQVWPDTFVEEGGLARNISVLRKALGGPSDAAYIETIPRRGYRFVAAVQERTESSCERSLAVLPLANLAGDASQEYFADGMTDELISQLMRIEALRVASLTSVMGYRGGSKPLRQIAGELGARWVVEGTVLHSGGRVRISARLIEGATESPLWSATYEKDLRDILELQNEVAGAIVREIRVKLTAPEKDRLSSTRPVTPEAYQDYLRGRYFLNKRTTADFKRSRDYFRQAIDRDPTYAPAHCGLADTYALMASSGYDVIPPSEAMPLARAAARNALAIDANLAEAHATLGYVALVYEWDWPAAEQHLERAISLNPAYATAHQWRGELFLARRQPQEATEAFCRALELDPLSIPCNLALGWAHYFSRRYDLAIEQYRRTLEIAPGVPMALYGLGLTYHHIKQLPDGMLEIQKAHSSSGGEAAAVMLMGVTQALRGENEAAAKALADLKALSKTRYVPAVYFAFIHSALDNVDHAFAALEEACKERSTYMIFLGVQPAMENLRSDPRFQNLMRRIGSREV